MNFDEKIQILTQRISEANREVIIQDRILGQTRERVAEIQGRINMLAELQQEKNPVRTEKPAGEIERQGPVRKKPGPKPSKKPQKKGSYKKIFSEEIDKFIEKNWEENPDLNLRKLIGDKFDKFYTVEQIKGHRKYLNLVSNKPGRKKGQTAIAKEPEEDSDENIDGMDLD